MVNKKYSFAGLSFRVDSEASIQDGEFYPPFYSDSEAADYYVKIKSGALPKADGTAVYDKKTAALYQNGSKTQLFSAYPSPNDGYIRYSCLERENDSRELDLTVEPFHELRDSTLFKSLNVSSLLLRNGVILFHSSFVITEGGEAIIFTGKSGIGKTTQALLWQKYRNALIVNGDRAALKIKDGVLTACGVPFCGSSDIALNREARVKAVVSLSQSRENKCRRLSAIESFSVFLSGTSYEPRNPLENRLAVDISEKAAACGVSFALSCRPDEGAVCELEKIIEG